MCHNRHIALIDSDILNSDNNDISDIFESILSIFDRTSGPFNDGKSGIYVDQEGSDNIDKLIERYGYDRDINLDILYALRDIQRCDSSIDLKDFQESCGNCDCLPANKIKNYSLCPNSKIFISGKLSLHKCTFVEVYPFYMYKVNYGYRHLLFKSNTPTLKDILFSEFNNLFNNLILSKNCFDSNIYNSNGSKKEIERKVFDHLCVLDDFVMDIWFKQKLPDLRMAELGSHGVEASGESPNTRKNKKAIRKRKFHFEFDGNNCNEICEWHTKIYATSGRIYFYVHERLRKVLIGKICRHL